MTNAELEEVICGLHRRIALTTAGTPLQDDLIKAVGALRIAVNRISELIEAVANRDRLADDLNKYIWKLEAQMPKEGEWLDEQRGRWIYAKCNLCGKVQDVRSNYCPNCGGKMKGEET